MPKLLRPETLFEDQDLIVINKPAGLLSTPDRYDSNLPHVLGVLDRQGALLVHRLDRDTSGVMLVAKNEASHRSMSIAFEEHRVEKIYHCIAKGESADDVFTIDKALSLGHGRRHLTKIDSRGKIANTSFTVVQRLGPFLLIEAAPKTGRTHQIRVHLDSVQLPIVADNLYGDVGPLYLSSVKRNYRSSRREERPLIGRLALHSKRLSIQHPTSNDQLSFEAEYPKDFRATLRQLSNLFDRDR